MHCFVLLDHFCVRFSQAVKALGIGLGTLASALGGYYAYRSAAQPSTSRVYSSAADEQASSSSSTESLKDRTWAVLRSRQWQDALVGVAGVYGAVGVGCGAFGFHGLRRYAIVHTHQAEAATHGAGNQ